MQYISHYKYIIVEIATAFILCKHLYVCIKARTYIYSATYETEYLIKSAENCCNRVTQLCSTIMIITTRDIAGIPQSITYMLFLLPA